MGYNADVEDVSGKMKREINSPEKVQDFGDRCVLRYQNARKLAEEYEKEDSNERRSGSKVKQQRISEDPKIAERQCEQCFKVFVSKNKMQRHMKTHTDQIDKNCDICGAPIKYSYNLVPHLKKCAQKLRTPCTEKEFKKYYPRFMDEFEKFRTGNLSDLPELPADFKFDDLGFIVEKNDPTRFSYTNYEFGKGLKNYEKKKNEEEKEDSDIEKEIASDDEET